MGWGQAKLLLAEVGSRACGKGLAWALTGTIDRRACSLGVCGRRAGNWEEGAAVESKQLTCRSSQKEATKDGAQRFLR